MISRAEIESVSKLTPKERYDYFIKKVVDFESMYGLKDPDGDWALAGAKDNSLFMLWPAKEFAEQFCVEDWSKCLPVEIDYEDFKKVIAPFILREKHLVNVFSVKEKTGFVVSIIELLRDLEHEEKWYG